MDSRLGGLWSDGIRRVKDRIWIMTGEWNWTLRSHDYCPVKLPFCEGGGGPWTPTACKYFGRKHCSVTDAPGKSPSHQGESSTPVSSPGFSWRRGWEDRKENHWVKALPFMARGKWKLCMKYGCPVSHPSVPHILNPVRVKATNGWVPTTITPPDIHPKTKVWFKNCLFDTNANYSDTRFDLTTKLFTLFKSLQILRESMVCKLHISRTCPIEHISSVFPCLSILYHTWVSLYCTTRALPFVPYHIVVGGQIKTTNNFDHAETYV